MIDLITRSAEGDEAAFAALYEETKNLVYRTAVLMLDDRREAEDALQEVYMKVYRTIRRYDPTKAAFTTWLYRITVNHCLNRRRRKRFRLVALDALPLGGKSPTIERYGADEELHQALNRLSDKLRAVVVLRYYWDLPYNEIAEILGIPVGTVKSRLHQAISTLRTDLEPGNALRKEHSRG